MIVKKITPEEKVFSYIARNSGATIEEMQREFSYCLSFIYKCLKRLRNRVYKDEETKKWHPIDFDERVNVPSGIHGLTLVFYENLEQTVSLPLCSYLNSNSPLNSSIYREVNLKYNSTNTFDFTSTNDPLSIEEAYSLDRTIKSFFINQSLQVPRHYIARVHYNNDGLEVIMEGCKCLTLKGLFRNGSLLTRVYKHKFKNGNDTTRMELEVTGKISFDEITDRLKGWQTLEALTQKVESLKVLVSELVAKNNKKDIKIAILEEENRKFRTLIDSQKHKSGNPRRSGRMKRNASSLICMEVASDVQDD